LKDSVDVSVILCAYNEEDVIEKTIGEVDRVMTNTGYRFEIIVVDDGSSDNTWRKAVNYKGVNHKGYLKIVSYRKNLGKGNAIKAGLEKSSGEYVVLLDSDLDINPDQIPPYIEALKGNDIAIASKWHPQSRVYMSLKRKFLSVGFNVLSRLLTGIKLKDTQSGLKAFKRIVFDKVSSNLTVKRYAFDLEMMATCNHSGFKIIELPVRVRITRESSVDFKEILRMLIDVSRVAYRLRFLKSYYRSS
jgi:glycosyltransferase involved in cell wall biosynthesis